MQASALRFSIRGIIAFTLFVALGMTALIYPSMISQSITMCVVLVCMLTAVLAAAVRSGAARAFWAGFALFGIAYLSLAFTSLVTFPLPTEPLLDQVTQIIWSRNQPSVPTYGVAPPYQFSPSPYRPGTVSYAPVSAPVVVAQSELTDTADASVDDTPQPSLAPDEGPEAMTDAELVEIENEGRGWIGNEVIDPEDIYDAEAALVRASQARPSSILSQVPQAVIMPPTYFDPNVYSQIRSIGHGLISIPFAMLGGIIAQVLFVTRRREAAISEAE